MKKYNLQSSLIIDALLSLSLVTSLCLIYIPMINHMFQQINYQQNQIEMKRILLSTLIKIDNNYENNEFNIYRYRIQHSNNKYCIKDKESNDEICIPQKNQ